jgi:hypothetical protein
MKERLGALLCIALGAVLITTGLTDSSGVTVGLAVPSCGGAPVVIGAVPAAAVNSCPTGTIAVTETTVLPSGATATPPPGGWLVDIASSCLNPGTGAPVGLMVTLPDNGTGTSDALFVYGDPSHTTQCTYTLSEHAVAGFTGVFSPGSPVVLPFNGGSTGNDLKVALTNTAEAATTTPTTAPPTSPSPTEVTVTDSLLAPSPTPTLPNESGQVVSASVPPIANTGPREQVRTSVYIGIALCLLGFALLFAASWSRRRGQHL